MTNAEQQRGLSKRHHAAMQLFDGMIRTYEGPALYAEPAFAYLNRSASSVAETVRRTLEIWFSRYPESERTDLRARFRSKDDQHHYSAFFELVLHELLLKMNCRIQIHPDSPHHTTSRCPDLLVEPPAGSRFYAEAIIVTGMSANERAACARMNDVYDAINRLESPNFFVGMDISGAPETPVPARRIRAFLRERLDELDPDEVAKLWGAGKTEAISHWQYEHEGWSIDFHPIPKSPGLREKPGVRPIGMRSFEGKWVDASTSIRDAITAKAGRYGDFEVPLVIAVNYLGEDTVDQIDVMDALFGKETYSLAISPSGATSAPRMKREPDGAWTSRSGPRYTRVSAVLLAIRAEPWTVGSAGTCLIHNPWAQRRYDSVLTRLSQGVPQAGLMHWKDGLTLGEALDLPQGWPL